MITGNYAISAGASGAIFAVVGALVFLVVRHRGKLPGPAASAWQLWRF
ncbi:MAG: rhomboid family intramembrane serine protease [Lachnospiraceae bacterium]